jgi:hypothetical protein
VKLGDSDSPDRVVQLDDFITSLVPGKLPHDENEKVFQALVEMSR